MKTNFSNLWRWDGAIGRSEFFLWGILLFVVKYNLDRLLSAAMLDKPWTLFDREQAWLYLWQTMPPPAERHYFLALLAVSLPFLWAGVVPPPLPLLEVKSSVVVNASPEKVWRNVVSFSELPLPGELIFRLGVAYPVRAEMRGSGVGAVRHCHFSTGPFVEPIQISDEPRLLKFSVTKKPGADGWCQSRAGILPAPSMRCFGITPPL